MSLILAVESSCDETAVAIYSLTHGLLSHALYSQIDIQKHFGGVIPEVASRSHLEKIAPLVTQALAGAGKKLSDIDFYAVTHKPGLSGSLLVGLCFVKALAYSSAKPLIGIDHLEGHIFSVFLENPSVPFPHICITASGGHTAFYLVHNFGEYTLLGTTRDDAAGEAFDKIAKLLELGYPGGPLIEKYAAAAGFNDYFQYPRSHITTLDVSFSGLKTAVLYDLVKRKAYDLSQKKLIDTSNDLKKKVASSLLVCVADIFQQKLEKAITLYPSIKAITFVGGVACNSYIKKQLQIWCAQHELPFFFPSPQFCTDNAGMIAYVASYKAERKIFSDLTLDIF